MLNITLSHSAVPVLLYPRRSSDPLDGLPKPSTFSCNVSLRAQDERVRIGGVIAVWQASLKLFKTITQVPVDWEPLETIVVPIHDGDFALEEGEEKHYSFEINIPAHLSVSRTTPWERIAHVVYIFALSPSPMYSVMPDLRDKADDVKEEDKPKGFISSLRRLSLGSRSSGARSSGGSDKGKSKQKKDTDDDWNEPTFPKLASPFIAEYHKEIIVTASHDEPGLVNALAFNKTFNLVGLGELEVHANSDMCIVGSCFSNCFRFANLNPLGTLHCYRVILDQRLVSADQAETWVDRFKLFELGRSVQWDKNATPNEYIWRGEAVQAMDKAKDPKRKVQPSNGIHFTYGPRFPSSVINARPTWMGFDPSLSTTEAILEFSFYWSVYGEDVNGQPISPPTEGDVRLSVIKTKVNIGTCAFHFHNVVAPTYSVQPSDQTDIAACMEPFARGTEPSSVLIKVNSWVEAGGQKHRLPQNYDKKAFSLLQHQFDTEGQCACFYAEAWDTSKPDPAKAEVVDGILDLTGVKYGPDNDMKTLRKEREAQWWKENGKKRKAVPGFAHMLAKACACERDEAEWPLEDGKAVVA